MDQLSLMGKNAVVIGGSRGIGRGMAEGLAQAGASVVLCSRKQEELDLSAAEIAAATGADVCGIAADISSMAGVEEFVERAVNRLGHVDILINSAGVNVRKAALDFSEADWDLVQNVQLKYVFFMCQAIARHMVEEEIKGRIINVGSLTSILGFKNMISYCAAKGAIVQMTKAYAHELAPYGICVNALAPGYTATEMTKPLFSDSERVSGMMARIPMKRFGEPEDYKGIVVYLASEASSYMTGQLVIVDGGWAAC